MLFTKKDRQWVEENFGSIQENFGIAERSLDAHTDWLVALNSTVATRFEELYKYLGVERVTNESGAFVMFAPLDVPKPKSPRAKTRRRSKRN